MALLHEIIGYAHLRRECRMTWSCCGAIAPGTLEPDTGSGQIECQRRPYFSNRSRSRIRTSSNKNQTRNFNFLQSVFSFGCTTTGGWPDWRTTTPAPWPDPGSHAIGTMYVPSPLSFTAPVTVVPGTPVIESPPARPGPRLLP